MKPWGSQLQSAWISGVFSSAPPFTLAEGGADEKTPPASPNCGGVSIDSLPRSRLQAALDYSSFRQPHVRAPLVAGPLIWIRRVAHSFGQPSVTVECHFGST